MITIFTPTYNRAHTLNRLYESLKAQDNKDFQWLIVDDGSLDNTRAIVEKYIEENHFSIRYIYQENQGKHIAINTGAKHALTEYFVIIDSDDYLLKGAITKIKELIIKIDSKDSVVGVTFIRFQEDIVYESSKYGKKEWSKGEVYQWEFPGESIYCIKTDVLKEFPFPKFDGEKFCPESLVLARIENNYKILHTDNVLVSGDYLEDGLSAKYNSLMEKSPRGAMLMYSEKIKSDIHDVSSKRLFVRYYWNIALKSKQISWFEKFSNIPLKWSLWFWKNRLLK